MRLAVIQDYKRYLTKSSKNSPTSSGSEMNCKRNLNGSGGRREIGIPADMRFNHSRDHPGVSDSVNTDCELKQWLGKRVSGGIPGFLYRSTRDKVFV